MTTSRRPPTHKSTGSTPQHTAMPAPGPVIVPITQCDDPPDEDIHSTDPDEAGSHLDKSCSATTAPGEPRVKSEFHKRGATPAQVTPIDNIGRISSIDRPALPEQLLRGFVGKMINEFGDVVDNDNTTVLGQVAGDLPEMVGRRVTTEKGDVLGDNGDLLGYINHIGAETDDASERDESGECQSKPAQETLESFTHGHSKSFAVDTEGNILDGSGKVVGKMNDSKTQWKAKNSVDQSPEPQRTAKPNADDNGAPPKQNAETFRKENESPSDIFLDVKSTREGIQLIIRIPTVFPDQSGPRIHIS